MNMNLQIIHLFIDSITIKKGAIEIDLERLVNEKELPLMIKFEKLESILTEINRLEGIISQLMRQISENNNELKTGNND